MPDVARKEMEKSIHRQLAAVINSIAREHGVRVTELEVEWLSVSTVAETTFNVKLLRTVQISEHYDGQPWALEMAQVIPVEAAT